MRPMNALSIRTSSTASLLIRLPSDDAVWVSCSCLFYDYIGVVVIRGFNHASSAFDVACCELIRSYSSIILYALLNDVLSYWIGVAWTHSMSAMILLGGGCTQTTTT
jgi:hypothetical protein